MPIYEYECLTCSTTFEKRQSFTDEPKAECPNGHWETRRILAAPAIVFKGSGFYINDSRNGNSSGQNGHSKSKSTDSKAESKSDSKVEATGDSKAKATAEAAD